MPQRALMLKLLCGILIFAESKSLLINNGNNGSASPGDMKYQARSPPLSVDVQLYDIFDPLTKFSKANLYSMFDNNSTLAKKNMTFANATSKFVKEQHGHLSVKQKGKYAKRKAWVLTLSTMVGISFVGLIGVSIVPLMQRVFYDRIITFLIALAIGCLTGDALLHLLPHAYETPSGDLNFIPEKENTYKGLCAIGGMYLFLTCERMLARRKLIKERLLQKRTPTDAPKRSSDPGVEERLIPQFCKTCETQQLCRLTGSDDNETNREAKTSGKNNTVKKTKVTSTGKLLVIGDAMHNFADGLAIGASFAEHVSAGLCTAIAVVCHELPHEIGFFAVLLKTGMSVRYAVFANCLSSVMSIAGSMCGLYFGQLWNISPWIFALIAGVFLYLALVDMLPELTIDKESILIGCILENAGFATGLAIMTVIAYYEKDIDSLLPQGN